MPAPLLAQTNGRTASIQASPPAGTTPQQSKEAAAPLAASTSTEKSEVPSVPGISGLLKGLNAGITYSALHDAGSGWSTVFQPAVSYSFSDRFAIDATVPIYMYLLTSRLPTDRIPANHELFPRRGQPGDVTLAFHAQFQPPAVNYQTTVSMNLPTGSPSLGLSSGSYTFDLNNHFDHNFAHITPSIDLGVGDSTSLIQPLIRRNFTTLGPLAHFQAGLSFPLFWGLSLSTSAYEQLPIGDQKIYTTIPRRGAIPAHLVSSRGVAEDNGFAASFDAPLDDHITLSSYYSRSLRLHDDIASVGLTYVFRSAREADEPAANAHAAAVVAPQPNVVGPAADDQPASGQPAPYPLPAPSTILEPR